MSEGHFLKSFNVFLEKSNQHYENTRTIQRYFPSVIQRRMSSFDLKQRSVFNILSVGSGTGEMDFEIVNIVQKELQNHQQWSKMSIFNRALEPDLCSSNGYKENIAKLGDIFASTFFEVRQQTFAEYQGSEEKAVSFDIVHFIHSLYHVDLEKAVLHCLEKQLNENGCLVCLTSDNENPIMKVRTNLTVLAPNDPSFLQDNTLVHITEKLIEIAEKCGWKHEIYSRELLIDITEVFDAESVKGNLLLDFITNIENFRKSVTKYVLEETLALMEQLMIVKDGKRFAKKKDSLALIYK